VKPRLAVPAFRIDRSPKIDPLPVPDLKRIVFSTFFVLSFMAFLPAAAPGRQPDRADRTQGEAAGAVDERQPVVVPEPTEQARRFYRGGNRLWLVDRLWAILLTAGLAFSGASARLRTAARHLGRAWFFTVGIYVIIYLAIVFVLDFPLSFYQGFVRLHAYGLSNQTFLRWLRNSLVGLGVDMAVGFAFAWVPFLLLARSPRRWWLYTALLSVPFLFTTMLVMPIWYDPLFNHFGEMKDKKLERSILALAERAEIDGSSVFEVDKSLDTNAVNAYVTGFLNTKRIVLWDTMIAKLSERQLLCVMGHEMGHYVLNHVVKSILLSAMVTLTGLFLVDWLGRRLVARFSGRLGFDRLADVASLPLLLLLIQVVSLALGPVGLAYSRFQEHEADRFALNLTRTNHSAATAFVRMQEENLSVPRPGPLYTIFRASHPSIGDRIDFCNSYHPWLPNQSESTALQR
jgi:Zn-dependent protease with chaperone function